MYNIVIYINTTLKAALINQINGNIDYSCFNIAFKKSTKMTILVVRMFIFKVDIKTLKIFKKVVFNKDRVLKIYLFIILVLCNILLILRFSYILDVFS